jgi:predicted RNA-binding protein with PUA-like domain
MTTSHWLVKSEPNTYSYADLERDGRTVWDGVRNPTAARHLREMKEGDEVFVYHSGDDKAVVGLAQVVREAVPDPGDAARRFVAVELAAVRPVKRPVTLAEMKAEPSLSDLVIIRQGRLSVAPVSDEDWRTILKMAGGA